MNLPITHPLVLGIDPGTLVTGYGLVALSDSKMFALDYGCIKPPSKASLHERYLIIYNSLSTLIEKYSPTVLAIETQYMHRNAQASMKLGMARGMAILAAMQNKMTIYEYSPKMIKLAATGSGRASKMFVQKMMQMALSLPSLPTPNDAADALAAAVCHFNQIKKSSPKRIHV